ncbi:glycosyltransferase [Candidatus Saccharibacteria bacterium]|nr:glycosyltransferase [Candidatus Saccharibacteria bacterium]
MKIAITSDIYYPMMNGVAVFARNLAKGLVAAGHEVVVICPSFKGEHYEEMEKETGAKIVHMKSARFHLYPDQINKIPEKKEFLGMQMPRLAYKNGIWWATSPYDELEEALLSFNPDVIHLQTAETIAIATVRFCKKYDVPLVSTGHAYPDNVTDQFPILKPVKKPVNAMVRAYMASFLKHAEYATMPTELAIGDLVPKNRKHFTVPVEALSNGIDLTEFKPGKPDEKVLKKYGLKTGVPRALYVGRVDPEKSIEKVIIAFSGLATKLPEAELVIVGDGIALPKLRELAAELDVAEKVKFLGKIVPPELIEIYRAGTVFVTASETETQGIVLIEAAATGLPLIAVDAGAVGELCRNRKNGILCPVGDVEAISRAIYKMLTDKALRQKYGRESLEIAKKHDLSRTLARFIEIYKEAIALKSVK